MSALDKQVGGDHYKPDPNALEPVMQPVELWALLGLNAFQGAIVKYITRHTNKNGAEDIDKAEHFFDLAQETGAFTCKWWEFWRKRRHLPMWKRDLLIDYTRQHRLSHNHYHALCNICRVGTVNGDAMLYRSWFRASLNKIRQECGYE